MRQLRLLASCGLLNPRLRARNQLGETSSGLWSGASWNRTSDLSIIREVSGFPLRPTDPTQSQSVQVTPRPSARTETHRDAEGRSGNQLLGQSWDRFGAVAMRFLPFRCPPTGTSSSRSGEASAPRCELGRPVEGRPEGLALTSAITSELQPQSKWMPARGSCLPLALAVVT